MAIFRRANDLLIVRTISGSVTAYGLCGDPEVLGRLSLASSQGKPITAVNATTKFRIHERVRLAIVQSPTNVDQIGDGASVTGRGMLLRILVFSKRHEPNSSKHRNFGSFR